MPLLRSTLPSRHAALALAAIVLMLAVLTAPAGAMPVDGTHRLAPPAAPAPTVVRETVVAPGAGGPTTIAYALGAVGVGLALVGAGYLGARIATRSARAHAS